jgi:hypothetical protein
MASDTRWPNTLRSAHAMQMQLALREALGVRATAEPTVLYHAMIRACDRSISEDARARPYSVESLVALAGLEPLEQVVVWTEDDAMYVMEGKDAGATVWQHWARRGGADVSILDINLRWMIHLDHGGWAAGCYLPRQPRE